MRDLVAPLGCHDGLADLERTLERLVRRGLADRIFVDFSVMSSFDYYTGIVVVAFAPGLGAPLGIGGRYDNTLGAYGREPPGSRVRRLARTGDGGSGLGSGGLPAGCRRRCGNPR